MSFWYLATPYSKYPEGLEEAFNFAVETRGLFVRANIPVFSPIIHSHPVAMRCGIDPRDHSIWLPAEKPILDAARGLIVLKTTGWQESYGIGQEIISFELTNREIIYMTPGVIPPELQRYANG